MAGRSSAPVDLRRPGTATANAGAQTIHSTSTSSVTVNATDNGGPQIITTGSGNDTIVIGSSSAIGTINAGAGSNSITLGATHSGVDNIVVTPGNSIQTAAETVTNFSMAVSDTLQLGSTTSLNSAQLGGGFVVTNGIATGGGRHTRILPGSRDNQHDGRCGGLHQRWKHLCRGIRWSCIRRSRHGCSAGWNHGSDCHWWRSGCNDDPYRLTAP